MPAAVGIDARATPWLVYPGNEENEQFRLLGKAWAEEAGERREKEP